MKGFLSRSCHSRLKSNQFFLSFPGHFKIFNNTGLDKGALIFILPIIIQNSQALAKILLKILNHKYQCKSCVSLKTLSSWWNSGNFFRAGFANHCGPHHFSLFLLNLQCILIGFPLNCKPCNTTGNAPSVYSARWFTSQNNLKITSPSFFVCEIRIIILPCLHKKKVFVVQKIYWMWK